MTDSEAGKAEFLERIFTQACALHEDGKLTAAEQLYLELLRRCPGVWQLYFNLGLLLFEAARHEEALAVYTEGLAINPDSEDLLFNTAICQKELGQFQAAAESYKSALSLTPDDTDCLYNLAGCYRAMGQETSAARIYEDILERRPEHLPSLNNLAYLVHKQGDLHRARHFYERILQIKPDHVSADFMRAALAGESRSQSPNAYVKEVFDEYAEHYEQSLTIELGYDLPSVLYQIYRSHVPVHKGTQLLDLGCGTGLVGEEFQRLFSSIVGVDISAKMLQAARQKNLYSALHANEIVTFLNKNRAAVFDLVISADVLPYIGVLEDLFKEVSAVVKKDGLFLFSVEDQPGEMLHPVLQQSGRFAHSKACVKAAAADTGWRIISRTSLDLRRERGKWLKGSIYLMGL